MNTKLIFIRQRSFKKLSMIEKPVHVRDGIAAHINTYANIHILIE